MFQILLGCTEPLNAEPSPVLLVPPFSTKAQLILGKTLE